MTLKILITGANGFIGANLVRSFIKKNISIVALSSSNNLGWRLHSVREKIEFYKCDISNKESLEKVFKETLPNGVIHTAAFGGYPNQIDEGKIFNTNLIGTTNLVNEAITNEVEWIINTGSSSEYGLKDKPMKETDICEPTTSYGISKLAGTLYAHSKGVLLNFPIFTFRIFSAYGPFEDPNRLIPYLFLKILKKEKPNLSNPRPVRDFIYIKDVVDAYIRLIKNYNSVKPGEIYNLGFGRSHKIKDVVDFLSEILNEEIEVDWGRQEARVGDLMKLWEADIEKLNTTLKWNPKYNLKNGLNETYKWFLSHQNLYGDI